MFSALPPKAVIRKPVFARTPLVLHRSRRRQPRDQPSALAHAAPSWPRGSLHECICCQRALGLDFAEALSGSLQNGVQAAHSPQAANRDIAILRIDLDTVAAAAGFFRRN